MRYLLLIIVFCTSSVLSFAQKNAFLNELAKKWDNARTYTIQTAELMPDSVYNFKPVTDEMTFREQLGHLSGNMLWLSSKFLTDQKPLISTGDFKGKSKKEMIELSQKSFDFVAEVLKEFEPSNLEDEIEFAGQKMVKRQILLLINDHLTHHRAQMIVYLRLKNIQPPKYVGW